MIGISVRLLSHGCCIFQTLETDFQLEIRWNGQSNVEVTIPGTYWNRTCGLCGTFDGDAGNDYTQPDGLLVSLEIQLCSPNCAHVK